MRIGIIGTGSIGGTIAIYRSLLKLCVALMLATPLIATAGDMSPRVVELDVAKAIDPVDRFGDLSIGADYPGTLIRDDSQAQLKTVVDELGFRYVRFPRHLPRCARHGEDRERPHPLRLSDEEA